MPGDTVDGYPVTPVEAMDPRLWRGRHYGADRKYAEDAANRLGGDAVVICHGRSRWAIYQPKFKAINHSTEQDDTPLKFTLHRLDDGEWVIAMEVDSAAERVCLTRGDLATLMSVTLPEAAALLDSLRKPGRPTKHHRRGPLSPEGGNH